MQKAYIYLNYCTFTIFYMVTNFFISLLYMGKFKTSFVCIIDIQMNSSNGLFSNIKGDLFGGITAGIVALPLALAFGVQSGMGAIAGLYGAIAIGIFASLFGGTPSQISGPTGPMTVVSAGIIALAIQSAGSLEKGMGIVIITFLLAGVFQILFGVIKIGKYIKYIPYPVISGFMTGIGLIIILLQLYPLIGHASPNKIIDVILQIQTPLSSLNAVSFLLGAGTILIIYLFPFITKAVPSTLVALIVMTLISFFMKLDVPIIGEIPSGLPELQLTKVFSITLKDLGSAIIPAISLAGLGAIDSLLTSVVADNISKTRHNSNRELIGQGIGNMVASIFGGIPGAGATMRTVVNVKSGGRTKLSGMVHGVFLLAIVLGIGPVVSYIPLSVLAGILITVGIGIIDFKGLKDIAYIPKSDAIIIIIVLLLTVFVDLLQAVGIGMVIASILFMKKASDLVEEGTKLSPLKHGDQEAPWADERIIRDDILKRIYIQRLDGPVFFGSVSHFQQIAADLPSEVQVVVIRMRKVPYMDQSGLYAFENVVMSLVNKGITVAITMIQPQPLYMLQKVHLVPNLIPEHMLFENLDSCNAWLTSYFKENGSVVKDA